MDDLADYMRRAAMAIVAFLELNRTGETAPLELRRSAEEAADGLLTMDRHLAAAEAKAEAEEAAKH